MERKLANWHWQRGALAVAVALVVSCLFVPPAGARAKTDREQAGLIGPVQTVSTVPVSFRRDQDGHLVIAREGERLVSTYDLQGNEIETAAYNSPSPGGSLYDKRSYTYDAQGKRTEMVSYHGDGSFWGKTVYIYDAQGHLTQTVSEEPARHIHNTVSNFYDAQGRLTEQLSCFNTSGCEKRIYTYNAHGNLTEEIVYEPDSSIKLRLVHTYDPQGKLTETAYYDTRGPGAGGAGIAKTVHTYDVKGNLSEVVSYYTDSSPPGRMVFTYEFDSRGNWIKQTLLSCDRNTKSGQSTCKQLSMVTNRTITYYEEGSAR